ncbi:Cu(I)-responsive transcriptional regulator [Pasteurellaceae bacterium Macca]|nr:Cu(I)-responsive transcriptional regulator [Pasteurellaceae bacterium Macca]
MNISEMAKRTNLSAKQIRDYEKRGLLPLSQRSLSNYRQYSEEEVARLQFISNARKVGFSLSQIEALLRLNDDEGRSRCEVKRLTEQHIRQIEQQIADLEAMLALLRHWNDECQGDDAPECPILQALQGQEVG